MRRERGEPRRTSGGRPRTRERRHLGEDEIGVEGLQEGLLLVSLVAQVILTLLQGIPGREWRVLETLSDEALAAIVVDREECEKIARQRVLASDR